MSKRNSKLFLVLICFFLSANIVFAEGWNELFLKADSLFEKQKYKEALTYSLQSLEFAEKNIGKLSKPYANSANLIGNIYYKLGDYHTAVKYFTKEKDAKAAAYGKDSPQFARALNNLSSVLSQLGRDRDAEPIMREALELKIRTLGKNDSSVATSAQNLGVLCFNLGKFNDAEQYYLMALKIREHYKKENPLNYAIILNNLGSLYKLLGNYSRAKEYLFNAYHIFNSVLGADNSSTVSSLFQIAMTFLASGENERAYKLLKENAQTIKRIKGESHPDYYYSIYNMALYYWSRENYSEARKLLKQVMNNVAKKMGEGHPLYSSCLNSLGLIFWQTGNLDSAEKYLGISERLREKIYGEEHFEYATALQNLAAIQKEQKKYDISDKNYKRVVELYINQINKVFPGLSETEKAKFYTKLKERFELYNLYVLSRMKEKPELLTDMYNFWQILKGKMLDASRKIKKEIFNSDNQTLIDKYNQWSSLKSQLSQLFMMTKHQREMTGRNIKEIELQINDLEKYLSANSAAFKTESIDKRATWKEVRNSLKPDEAAIEIIRVNMFDRKLLDSSYYMVLIITSETQNYPDYVLLNKGYELENLYINNYLNSIRFQLQDKYSYPAFWEKIEEKISGKKTIYISTDGIYNKINIATLLRPDGSYVVDDKNIIIVPKTSDLVKQRTISANNKAYLFGNPEYAMSEEELSAFTSIDTKYPILTEEQMNLSRNEIPQLPGTQREINNISEFLKQQNKNVKVYKKINAREDNFKRINDAGVIHLATHAYFIPEEQHKTKLDEIDVDKPINEAMLKSGLLFTGATNTLFSDAFKSIERENGILTAYEASSLLFDKVNLLVLSACETGLGEIKNGEGVYGLQRAFQIAGVHNMIMSLWKVNDYATEKLMTSFYSYWLDGQSISDALRAAQLELKEEFPNPYYWGAFIVIKN